MVFTLVLIWSILDCMEGRDLQKLAESVGANTQAVCNESGIQSRDTVLKVYRGQRVKPTTRFKVEHAIKRLAARAKAVS